MKESLELLNVNSSGLEETRKKDILNKKLSDNESLIEADKLLTNQEKENFLKDLLKDYPQGYVMSKILLANIVRVKDHKLAYNMILSATYSDPVLPDAFFALAELAFSCDAFDVSLKSLRIASWLRASKLLPVDNNITSLKEKALENKKLGILDHSKNDFWNTKIPSVYEILERVYYESEPEKLFKYCKYLVEVEKEEAFEDVLKILSLLNDPRYFALIKEYIQVLDVSVKDLFLGLYFYYSKDIDSAIKTFQSYVKKNPLNSKAMLYLSLSYLKINDKENFIKISQLILPESDDIFNAVYFISSALSKQKLLNMGGYPNDKKISKEISLILQSLVEINNFDLVVELHNAFSELDFYSILSYLPLYVSDLFVRYGDLQKAESVLNKTSDPELHRIRAWIYRLKGDEKSADKELINYRKRLVKNEDTPFYCKLIDLNLPEILPLNIPDLLVSLEQSYLKCREIISDIEMEYGLNSMTCIEASCQDCCTKTFPLISFIEYLYMKNWLDSQDVNLKNQITDKSKAVVNAYRLRYSKDPEFIVGEGKDYKEYYPLDFVFDCPSLGDNKCTIYEVRPFTCRAYGFTSLDGYKYKGCNYFLEQFKTSTSLENFRKVISTKSFAKFTLKVDKKLFGKKVVGFIPLWFAQSHEETMAKINAAISSYS